MQAGSLNVDVLRGTKYLAKEVETAQRSNFHP